MTNPRFQPKSIVRNPDRFGRAGADWAGWETVPVVQRSHPVDRDVLGAAAWTQHHLAVRLRRKLGYPSADDPAAVDQYAADDDWTGVNRAARSLKAFADRTGFSDATVTDKLSGRALATHLDLHQWAHEAGTTLAAVLKKHGPLPPR